MSLAEQIAGEGPGSGPPPADPETDSARRRERFLWFTRTVPMPVTQEDGLLIMHTPGGHPGDPDVFCTSP